jgi:AsmA protein
VRTPFTALSGTGVVREGVVSNDDLNVAMQYLKVSGRGSVDIPASTLDYHLVATVLRIPRESALGTEMEEMIDARIPVNVTGALTDPKVRPDVEGYLKGKVTERIEQEKEKIEEKIRDKLGDKLKDLFN